MPASPALALCVRRDFYLALFSGPTSFWCIALFNSQQSGFSSATFSVDTLCGTEDRQMTVYLSIDQLNWIDIAWPSIGSGKLFLGSASTIKFTRWVYQIIRHAIRYPVGLPDTRIEASCSTPRGGGCLALWRAMTSASKYTSLLSQDFLCPVYSFSFPSQ